MSHDPWDDDTLDAALRQLGAPAGAEPSTSARELLVRAGTPVADAPRAVPAPRRPARAGLAGTPLAAALVAAVGAGFWAGTLATRAPAPPSPPDARTPADDSEERATVRGVLPDAPVPSERSPVAGAAVAAPSGSAGRARATRVLSRARAPSRAGVALPSASVGRSVDEVVRAAGMPSGPATAMAPDAPVAMNRGNEGEPEDATLPDASADSVARRARGRVHDRETRAVDAAPAGAGRLHVGIAGALSSLGVEPPRDGVHAGHADARSAELVVGYARRVSDAALAPWVGVDAGFGRVWAVADDVDAPVVAALPTWSADASAGASWTRGAARLDLGLGLGTRGLPGGAWAAHRDDDDDADHDERSAVDDDPRARAPLALIGPRLNVSLGGDRGPRARLGMAPSVALRPGHRPDAWFQLSLGGELPG